MSLNYRPFFPPNSQINFKHKIKFISYLFSNYYTVRYSVNKSCTLKIHHHLLKWFLFSNLFSKVSQMNDFNSSFTISLFGLLDVLFVWFIRYLWYHLTLWLLPLIRLILSLTLHIINLYLLVVFLCCSNVITLNTLTNMLIIIIHI